MYPAPPCVYKKGGGLLPNPSLHGLTLATHRTHSLTPRYWHLPQSSSPLAETWELPSLSRLACTPLLQALHCKIIQCTHTPLLDVRPRGWIYDIPLRYCVTSCVNYLGLGTRNIITSWCQAARSGHRQLARQVGERCVTF